MKKAAATTTTVAKKVNTRAKKAATTEKKATEKKAVTTAKKAVMKAGTVVTKKANKVVKTTEKAKTTATADPKYNEVFTLLSEGKSAKEVRAIMCSSFNTEGSCKSFIGASSAAYKAVTKGGDSKMAKYAAYLAGGSKGTAPEILPKSKRFTTMAYQFCKKAAEKKAE